MIPAHQIVGTSDAPHLGFVLHGALGAGHNFRSFVRRLVAERPEYRFALVDLRNHGHSQGAPGPHTLSACVGDLLDLADELDASPEVVIGHSFGGKVALEYAADLAEAASDGLEGARRVRRREALRQVWALDSDPGRQRPDPSHEVLRVLECLRALPGPFANRQEAIRGLQAQGLSSGLSQWLATNLERSGQEFEWRFDIEGIAELMQDYFERDLWPFLETTRDGGSDPEFHLVVAERSDRWTGDMRERAAALPPHTGVTLHELPDSGHWVHVDNPDGLLQILLDHL